MIKVYLAGKMGGLTYEEMTAWREDAKKLLKPYGYLILDPCDTNLEEIHEARLIKESNLMMIRQADVILMELAHKELSPGTFTEIGICAGCYKPVIAFSMFTELQEPPSYITHPWILAGTTHVYEVLEEAVSGLVRAFPIIK